MNMFTGDAAGKGTYYTDPLFTRLQSLVQQGSTGEDLSAYDAYRLRRRYARKMTLQTAHNYHKLREMTYTQLWQLAAQLHEPHDIPFARSAHVDFRMSFQQRQTWYGSSVDVEDFVRLGAAVMLLLWLVAGLIWVWVLCRPRPRTRE